MYLTDSKNASRLDNTFIKILLNTIIALFLVFGTAVSHSHQAFADDDQKAINDSYDEYISDLDIEPADEENGRTEQDVEVETAWGIIEKTDEKREKYEDPDNQNDFGYLIYRALFKPYINQTPKAVNVNGDDYVKEVNCDLNDPFNGSLNYHNCDIPTIGTEIAQNLYYDMLRTGPKNATVQSAYSEMGFGLPSKLPVKEIPLDLNTAKDKFTALELFGYNVKYTSYAGEWDHIKSNSGARALLNIGIGSSLKLGVAMLKNAFVAGVNHVADTASEFASKSDNIFVKGLLWIGGATYGLMTGGEHSISAIINTYVDTAEMNMFAFYNWYRPNFHETLYNARALTQEERALMVSEALMKAFLEMEYEPSPTNYGTPGETEPSQISGSNVGLVGDSLMNNEEFKNALSELIPGYEILAQDGRSAETGKQQFLSMTQLDEVKYIVVGLYVNDVMTTEHLNYYMEKMRDDQKLILVTGDTSSKATEDTQETAETSSKNIREFAEQHVDRVRVAEMDKVIDLNGKDDFFTEDDLHVHYTAEGYGKYANEIVRALNNFDQAQRQQIAEFNEWMEERADNLNDYEWLEKHPELNFNAPWKQYYCTDAKGNDVLDASGKPTFLYKPGTAELNDGCSPVRAPIQNGAVGNGYTSNADVPKDTRYSPPSILNVFNGNAIGDIGLWWASFFTKISNFMIDLSFSPIIATLGLDELILAVVDNFTQGIFFPLAALAVSISAVYVFFTSVRRGEYLQGFKDLGKMALLFFVGVVLLAKPANVVALADDVPSKIENTFIGILFNVDSTTGDNVCSASGSSDTTILSGMDGDLPFTKESAIRTMQCEVWRAFVFNPYVVGQWGTSYDNLDDSKMLNQNSDLVGDAEVPMGGGITVNNWGLYHLASITSGNTTQEDLSIPNGMIKKDFYKMVDLQAGINNGAGTDSRYFEDWRGNAGSRAAVGLFASVASFIGLLAIGFFSLIKIEATIVMSVMLLMLPIMLLLGLVRGWGFSRFREYGGTLVALLVKRVFTVFLICMMLMTIVAVSTSTDSALLNGLLITIICLFFFTNRRMLTDLMTNSVASVSGGLMAQNLISDPSRFLRSKAPLTVNNARGRISNQITSRTGGFIAGYMQDGTFEGAMEQSREAATISDMQYRRTQRRKGLSLLTRVSDATDASKRELDKLIEEKRKDGTLYNNEVVNNNVAENAYKRIEADVARRRERILSDTELSDQEKTDLIAKLQLGDSDEDKKRRRDKVYSETVVDFDTRYGQDRLRRLQEIDLEKGALNSQMDKIRKEKHDLVKNLKQGENESNEDYYARRAQKMRDSFSDDEKEVERELTKLRKEEAELYRQLGNKFNKKLRREINVEDARHARSNTRKAERRADNEREKVKNNDVLTDEEKKEALKKIEQEEKSAKKEARARNGRLEERISRKTLEGENDYNKATYEESIKHIDDAIVSNNHKIEVLNDRFKNPVPEEERLAIHQEISNLKQANEGLEKHKEDYKRHTMRPTEYTRSSMEHKIARNADTHADKLARGVENEVEAYRAQRLAKIGDKEEHREYIEEEVKKKRAELLADVEKKLGGDKKRSVPITDTFKEESERGKLEKELNARSEIIDETSSNRASAKMKKIASRLGSAHREINASQKDWRDKVDNATVRANEWAERESEKADDITYAKEQAKEARKKQKRLERNNGSESPRIRSEQARDERHKQSIEDSKNLGDMTRDFNEWQKRRGRE